MNEIALSYLFEELNKLANVLEEIYCHRSLSHTEFQKLAEIYR